MVAALVIYIVVAIIHMVIWLGNYPDRGGQHNGGYENFGRFISALLWCAIWPIMSLICGLAQMFEWARD